MVTCPRAGSLEEKTRPGKTGRATLIVPLSLRVRCADADALASQISSFVIGYSSFVRHSGFGFRA